MTMLEIPSIWRIRRKERGTLDPVVRSIYVLCSKRLEQIRDLDGTLVESPRSQWLLIVLAEEVGGVDEPILCDLKYLWPDVDLYQEGIQNEPPNELNLEDLIMRFDHTTAEFPVRHPMEFLARIVFHGWQKFLSEKVSSILSVFI